MINRKKQNKLSVYFRDEVLEDARKLSKFKMLSPVCSCAIYLYAKDKSFRDIIDQEHKGLNAHLTV